MATQNLGRVKIVWKGEYNSATAYVVDDAVSYEGSSYVCIQNATNKVPTNTSYWDLMAEKGDTGATGASPTITASATTDGTSSTTPTVNVTKSGTDENPNFAFAFTGLKGDKGDKGDTGASGGVDWPSYDKTGAGNLLVNQVSTGTVSNVAVSSVDNDKIKLVGTANNANNAIYSKQKIYAGSYTLSAVYTGTSSDNQRPSVVADLCNADGTTKTSNYVVVRPSSTSASVTVTGTDYLSNFRVYFANGDVINMEIAIDLKLSTNANTEHSKGAMTNRELTENKVDWSSYAKTGAVNRWNFPAWKGVGLSDATATWDDETYTLTLNVSANGGRTNITVPVDAQIDVVPGEKIKFVWDSTGSTSGATLTFDVFKVGDTSSPIASASIHDNQLLLTVPANCTKITYRAFANLADKTIKMANCMCISQDNTDTTFQPYAMTNRELTEKVDIAKTSRNTSTFSVTLDAGDVYLVFAGGGGVSDKLTSTQYGYVGIVCREPYNNNMLYGNIHKGSDVTPSVSDYTFTITATTTIAMGAIKLNKAVEV